MYKCILLAYNGSGYSAVALRQAAELTKFTGAHLHIIGIVATNSGIALAQSAGSLDALGMEHKRIEDAVNAAADRLREHELSVHVVFREGDPAAEIINEAYRINADLCVLGHTDKGLLSRWFQGDIGSKLLSHLPCSLLIARDK